jgi:hypothetical protein
VEAHGHWRSRTLPSIHASDCIEIVRVIIHFEDLLLLSCEVLCSGVTSHNLVAIWLTIHHSKAH